MCQTNRKIRIPKVTFDQLKNLLYQDKEFTNQI